MLYYLKQKTICVNLSLMAVIWVTCSFNYYMMGYKVKYLAGDMNLNQMASLLAEALACISTGCLLRCFSAKGLLVSCFSLSAFAGIMIIIISAADSEYGSITAFFVLFAKMGIAGGFNIVYIEHPKLFPTLFSTTSMGMTNFISRLATVFAPLTAEVDQPVPMLVFSCLCIASVVCSLLLRSGSS